VAGKQRWWNALFRRKDATTTVEVSDELVDGVGGPPMPDAAGDRPPAAGAFSFLAPEPASAPPGEPPALFDTQPNASLTTGRLRALGLAPVHVPSLAEQVLLYRVVAQEHAAANPAAALARWQAILALCPDDVEARVGRAAAQTALGALDDAEGAWRAVLEICPDHPEAMAALNPTELRRAIDARVAGGEDA
jgi:hypothetical protein